MKEEEEAIEELFPLFFFFSQTSRHPRALGISCQEETSLLFLMPTRGDAPKSSSPLPYFSW